MYTDWKGDLEWLKCTVIGNVTWNGELEQHDDWKGVLE